MLGGGCGSVDGGHARDLGVLQEKLHGVGFALGPGVGHIYEVTAIMLHCGAKVPPIYAMGFPRHAFVRFFVYHNLCDRWS